MSPNVATVQRIYEAFGRGDVATILSHLAPGVQWEHDANDHGIPWLRPGTGHDHVLSFFGELNRGIDLTVFQPRHFLEGDGMVAVAVWLEATSRLNGDRGRELEMHLWSFGEDGKVTRFRHVCDTLLHARAAGIVPQGVGAQVG